MQLVFGQRLGDEECPYLRRWGIILGGYSIRLHHWHRSDDKRAPHTHPWWFVTLVLKGRYEDWSYRERANGDPELDSRIVERLVPGSVRYRPANHIHSVAVEPGGCWTLIVTGRPLKRWGFWTKRKDGSAKFVKSNKYFLTRGHHPCDQL